jgi:predicted anti-sigma-YlaC factor YlaD
MTAISQSCERACWWASLRADGELSALESALLDAHLGHCLSCRRFAGSAEDIAAVLRGAPLERPPPLALVLPRRRPALRALQITAAAALIIAAGAVAALVGVDRQEGASTAVKPVAIVAAADESSNTVRALHRTQLLTQTRQVAPSRRVPFESL